MLKVHARNLWKVAILCLQGRIVHGETAPLRRAVNSQSGVVAVILDLARVSTIDAGGLGVMLELRAQTQAKGIGFTLINVNGFVSNVLKITRLDSVFEVSFGEEVLPRVARDQPVMELARCA